MDRTWVADTVEHSIVKAAEFAVMIAEAVDAETTVASCRVAVVGVRRTTIYERIAVDTTTLPISPSLYVHLHRL